MSIKRERLLSLIEFAQQTAALKANPISDLNSHKVFAEYEHSLKGLPGMHFNEGGEEGEIWLRVERLHEIPAPTPKSRLLNTWIDLSNSPNKEPALRNVIERSKLVEIGYYDSAGTDSNEINSKTGIYLRDFEEKDEIESLLNAYTKSQWNIWANEEKNRRLAIKLYGQLYTIKQQLEGGIVDTQIEIVWGIGISIWKIEGTKICYPLITQTVDIVINESTMAIELRPRNTEPRLELDIYTAAANSGCANLEKAWKEFNSKQTQSLSPFDRGTFEAILKLATACLDAKGIYWPSQIQAEDRSLPSANDELKITDTWVLFARPRSKNLFIQDLERFKSEVKDENDKFILPNAIASIVTEPSNEQQENLLSNYRGLSMVYGNNESTAKAPQDLYFPMSFNDDQVRIVQLLDSHDGVVVQGPPGTGKTHTIANIICHYFALGKRVLVTSMKEPALSVLRDKLPPEIRSLAISLLASEHDGMKQFEHAIYQISSEIQHIDKQGYRREIADLETNRINALHGQLSLIDQNIESWAKQSLHPISINGNTITPVDAAKVVIENSGCFEWLDDALMPSSNYDPQFNDADIVTLRNARKLVSSSIAYLSERLPEIDTLPDSKDIIELHQDLSKHTQLSQAIEAGKLLPIPDYEDNTIHDIAILLENLYLLSSYKRKIQGDNSGWPINAYNLCKQPNSSVIGFLAIFEKLSKEIFTILNERKRYIEKPVFIPDDAQQDEKVIAAINNKIENKLPFGIVGLLGKSKHKTRLEEIKVVSKSPESIEDWKHIQGYLNLLKSCREIISRWNSVAPELGIEIFISNDPIHITVAEHKIDLFLIVKNRIALEEKIHKQASILLSTWTHKNSFVNDEALLQELQTALANHILRHKLSSSWIKKERFQKTLSKFGGEITEKFKTFAADVLGNPHISNVLIQNEWSKLTEELRYLTSLKSHFADILDICERIENSGAKNWANVLRSKPVNGTFDYFLPDNWREVWKLRRLANYLEAADGRLHLKRLFRQRLGVEVDLAKAYREVIVKRTWLKLAENATPDVRSALEAFRSSIAKIGKGTGIRAIRHRQDARNAASRANHVIPCWIMPHWRVSESLPPDFGCFDLVIIDEASQSDLTALPALLRAKKVLIVGDDKQVSPDGIGLEENKILSLMNRYLSQQVEIYRAQMTPERSIYDLLKVVFAGSSTMLREHFRCAEPIIEYSKRAFYNHEIRPIRLAKSSERLDPPLIDVFVADGFKKGDINEAEARFIVDEIKRICADPQMYLRTIGVVSLLGDKQTRKIWEMLEKEVGLEEIKKHQIACGDARTFQGKEKSIMFLSMVSIPGDVHAMTKVEAEQRFNVAASRAQDRMYLVRSVGLEHLSLKDELRRGLISHFLAPFAQDEARVVDLRSLCESDFEREFYDLLTERGYKVIPQVKVGGYRIDMVVEGNNDTRLAIECDGDQYHGEDKWEDDMRRQRTLERVGWQFWRCFASIFVRNRREIIEDLIATLNEKGIEPIGGDAGHRSIHTESRTVIAFPMPNADADNDDV